MASPLLTWPAPLMTLQLLSKLRTLARALMPGELLGLVLLFY
jgi:hypothetical protein